MIRIFTVMVVFTAILSCTSNTKQKMTSEEMQNQEREEFKKIAEANAEAYAKMPYFPAEIFSQEQHYSVQITATSGMFFTDEFAKYDLYGNGYCWEGIIEQLIGQKNPSLLNRVDFDSEADVCFISCSDEVSMNELAEIIHSFCSTKEKFLALLESIDTDELDC